MTLSSGVPVLAIVSSRSLRQRPMFQLLLHMACAGVLLGLMTTLLNVLLLLDVTLPPFGCEILLAVQRAAGTSWSSALAAVSVERYIAVEHGLRYFSLLTPGRVRLLHAAVLANGLVMFLLNVPDIVAFAIASPRAVACMYLDFTSDFMQGALTVHGIIFTALTLLLSMIVGKRGMQQDRAIRRQLPHLQQQQGGAGGHKALYSVIRLAVLTATLTMPHVLLTGLHLITGAELRQARRVAGLLRMVLFVANGWLFGYWCEDLRERYKTFWRLLLGKWRKQEGIVVVAQTPPPTVSALLRRLVPRERSLVVPLRPLPHVVQRPAGLAPLAPLALDRDLFNP